MVSSSTAAIFGNTQYVPIDEVHPQIPINLYGQTKLVFEHVLNDNDNAYGIKSVSLRYFNASGANPDVELGERHDPETQLIPLALRATDATKPGLSIFGSDYNTKVGTCIRDYVYIMDLCDAHMLAIDHLFSGAESRQYNLGNGEGYSALEVVQTVEKITGKKVNAYYQNKRSGDSASLVADSSSIRADWGWRPKYNLEEIVCHAWRWECKL